MMATGHPPLPPMILRFDLPPSDMHFIMALNLALQLFIQVNFKKLSLYFSLPCHSRGQSVPCGSYNNLDNKPEITCNNINGGSRKYAINN